MCLRVFAMIFAAGFCMAPAAFGGPALVQGPPLAQGIDAYPRLTADCLAALAAARPPDFDFWLDGAQQALAMAPNNLAYAKAACGDTGYLTRARLQDLGAPERLLAA